MGINLSRRPSYNGPLDRLVFAATAARDRGYGLAILLGAGCSLTSIDRNISTASVVRRFVANIDPSFADQDDVSTFRAFVSHWRGLGSQQRREALSEQLSDLEPSRGYLALRRLVELGYVRHIVTTNFDLMVDRVLKGVPHRVRIGTGPWQHALTGQEIVTVIKIHGDISHGEMRFDPRDIDKLPDTIANDVRFSSSRPVLVCGFRGQDRGVMSALDASSGHTAFWASPERPDPAQNYIYDNVADWMCKRESANNYLSGDLGFFDDLFEELLDRLSLGTRTQERLRLPTSWERTRLAQLLRRSPRIHEIFLGLFDVAETLTSPHPWRIQPPGFAASHRGVEETLCALLSVGGVVDLYTEVLENEGDAFFLATCIDLAGRSIGWHGSPASLVAAVRQAHGERHPQYDLGDEFWDCLAAALVCPQTLPSTCHFRLGLNNRRRLSLVISNVQTRILAEACVLIRALALAACPADADAVAVSTLGPPKALAAAAMDQLTVEDGRCILTLPTVTPAMFRSVVAQFFAELTGGCEVTAGCYEATRFRLSAPLRDLPDTEARPTRGLWEYIEARSETSVVTFVKNSRVLLQNQALVSLDHDTKIDRFLAGPTPGLILGGPSGSGKTSSIVRLTQRRHVDPASARRLLCIPLDGRQVTVGQTAASLFFGADVVPDDASVERFVQRLDSTLALRETTLLLALDAVNEMAVVRSLLYETFASAVTLVRHIQAIGSCHIKVLVSGHERLLRDLLTAEEQISVSAFTWPEVPDDQPRPLPIISVRPLSLPEQLSLVDIKFPSTARDTVRKQIMSSRDLQAVYSDVYLMTLAAKRIEEGKSGTLSNPTAVFAQYKQDLLDQVRATGREKPAAALLDAYFDSLVMPSAREQRVTRFALLHRLNGAFSGQAGDTLRILQDVGILRTETTEVVGSVAFRHQRLELAFLADYLRARLANEVQFTELLERSAQSEMLREGFRFLIQHLLDDRGPEAKAALSQLARYDTPLVPTYVDAIVNAVESASSPENVLSGVLSAWRSINPDRADVLCGALVGTLSAALGSHAATISKCAQALFDLTVDRPAAAVRRAELALVLSQAAFRRDDRTAAFAFVAVARSALDANLDAKMLQAIELQEASIVGRWRSKKEAMSRLRDLYQSQKVTAPVDMIAATALELGSILRDNGLLDEALAIYSEVGQFAESMSDAMRHRLELNLGVVLKNRMQNVLRPARRLAQRPTADVIQQADLAFSNCHEHLLAAVVWAERAGAFDVQLSGLSEVSEATILLCYARPELLSEAKLSRDRLGRALNVREVVTRRVEWHRQGARLAEFEGRYDDALGDLTAGRALAAMHQQSYNVCDCDYQLARLALFAVLRGQVSLLGKGIAAAERAVAYFETETDNESPYLADAREVLQRLRDFASF